MSEYFKDPRSIINRNMRLFFENIDKEINEKDLSFLDFPRIEISRRIKQLILKNFTSALYKTFNDPEYNPKACTLKNRNQVVVKPSTKDHLIVSNILILSELFRFAIIPLYAILKGVALFLFRKKQTFTQVSIAIGLSLNSFIQKGKESNEFIKFCREGPLEIFKGDEDYIIQSPVEGDKENFFFSEKNCYFYLFRKLNISFDELMFLFHSYFEITIKFLKILLIYRPSIFLIKDVWMYPLIHLFVRKNLLNRLIITNSNYLDIEMWLKQPINASYSSHMVWYSGGFNSWYQYETDEFYEEFYGYKLLSIQNHWVWTQAQKNWLDNQLTQHSNVRAVGPIMFYMPKEGTKTNEFKISVFDTTPVKEDFFNEVYSKDIYYYNQYQNIKKFVQDIIEKSTEIDPSIKIFLKTKRNQNKHHHPEYFEYLQKIEKLGVQLVDPNANIFKEISSSDLVIAMPPTSPIYIADMYKTPSYFYDPLGFLKRDLAGEFNAKPLIKGENELEEKIRQEYKSKKQ